MKRWAPVLVIAVMILGTAGACDPPPPPGWIRPVVEAVTVSPDPVVAGSSVTISAIVTDDRLVQSIDYHILQPDGQRPGSVESGAPLECDLPAFEPASVVEIDITCSVPDFALNGTWEALLQVSDGETHHIHGANYGHGRTEFEVTGGSNDLQPPVIESVTFDPQPFTADGPFIVTVQASDDHLVTPQRGAYLGYVVTGAVPTIKRSCDLSSLRELSPTLHEWVFECPEDPEIVPGVHQMHFNTADINGNLTSTWFDMEVVAGP